MSTPTLLATRDKRAPQPLTQFQAMHPTAAPTQAHPTLHAQPVLTSSAGQHCSHQKDGVAGWLAVGTMLPNQRHIPGTRPLTCGLLGMASWGVGAPGLHMPSVTSSTSKEVFNKDLKLCSL